MTTPWRATVISLFPEVFPGPLRASVIGRGLTANIWSLDAHDIRDFGEGKHRQVDDTPAGGGPGMVLRADVISNAIGITVPPNDTRPKLLMSPRGTPLNQKRVRELSEGGGAVIVCGRFEGVDQRAIDLCGLEEVSIGDYVLAGGEVAAMVLIEAVVRLLPGVIGDDASTEEESFEKGLLEYPQYTRPADFRGSMIPEILTSGDHKRVAEWRRKEAESLTEKVRPDLWSLYGDPIKKKADSPVDK
ncbi:MAG: tRNA (guanosine(37)-N1)-methyltransferase TrmD [Pseudomonadota bacterium]